MILQLKYTIISLSEAMAKSLLHMLPGRAVVATCASRLRPAPDTSAVFGLPKLLQRPRVSDDMRVRNFVLATPVHRSLPASLRYWEVTTPARCRFRRYILAAIGAADDSWPVCRPDCWGCRCPFWQITNSSKHAGD